MRFKYLAGFTFSEFLIALFLIGFIFLLIIPKFRDSINQTEWTKAQNIFEDKLGNATTQMNSAGALSGYFSNESFVDVFSNYMKSTKRCSVNELSDCFAPLFKTQSGQVIATVDLKTGADLGHSHNTSNLVGLQFSNGINAIVAFDPDCENLNLSDKFPFKSNFPTKATTACLSIIYDVNGFKKPNTIGKDIRTLNAIVTDCDGIKIKDLCVGANDTTYNPFGTFVQNSKTYDDWWAGAINACEAQGMRLPSRDELNIIYKNRKRIKGLSKFAYYWSSTEDKDWKAWVQNLNATGNTRTSTKSEIMNVRCVK